MLLFWPAQFWGLDTSTICLLLLGGLVAGFINTLAANGSAVSLLMMSSLDISTSMANATNRVGVLVQSAVSSLTYKHAQEHKVAFNFLPKVIYSCIGSVLGAQCASFMPRQWLEYSVAGLMLFLLWLVWSEPQKWLKTTSEPQKLAWYEDLLIFLGIGFYGGYIQMGVGALLFVALVRGCGLSIKDANLFKNSLVFFFTIPAFLVFVWNKQIHWPVGIVLVFGQSLGAWLAARFGSKHPQASKIVRYLLIICIVAGFFLYSGLLAWLWELKKA
ncbi:MAG: sulfite exporter TauE/SafE family protein [Cytophagales bacterium]|nr:MAG: sulfite exporter TauE/SafE family protein [Cytophagales bacterium]TAF61251.1 MAG: sulfite exporter TauE/SafE family protein [Cytophagales bacterium]